MRFNVFNKNTFHVSFIEKNLICTWRVKSLIIHYTKHIKKGSTIVHDKEKSHNILVDNLDLISETYSNEELKNIEDKDNPLAPVNNFHSLAKSFMRQHGSYNRDNLQDWMNLLWFILNELYDKYTKVLRFIE